MDFVGFNKIGRYNREIIVTEKINGTNAQVYIGPDGEFLVGSRTRWITPENDNHGFARWAYAHKDELTKLGPGRHFGEWWGSGIQSKYGLKGDDKRWSLFNVTRWCLHGQEPQVIPNLDPTAEPKYQDVLPACVSLVPVLWRGNMRDLHVPTIMKSLELGGSLAAPGFMDPEGIVIYCTSNNALFKVTLKNDDVPKTKVKKQ